MKNKILIVVVFILSFSVCKSQDLIIKYRDKNNVEMEKLDIKALDKLRNKLIKENKGGKEIINEKGREIKAEIISGSIYYSEKIGKKTTRISGNFLNSFMKYETEEGSPIERRSQFYPNGNLKQTGEVEYKSKGADYAIGTWYFYDENGKLIDTYEYNEEESLFLFTKEDVTAYVKSENLDSNGKATVTISKLPQLIINGKVEKEAKWIIKIYYWENFNVRRIVLDARTGEKLGESLDKIRK